MHVKARSFTMIDREVTVWELHWRGSPTSGSTLQFVQIETIPHGLWTATFYGSLTPSFNIPAELQTGIEGDGIYAIEEYPYNMLYVEVTDFASNPEIVFNVLIQSPSPTHPEP